MWHTDEKFCQWLAGEYEREADLMEAALMAAGCPESDETPEETQAAYERLVRRLQADGVWRGKNMQ